MAVSAPKPLVAKVEPKSQHIPDTGTQPFLQPDFDPADYLNSTLPPLSIPGSTSTRNSRSVPLSEVSSQLQTLLSQLTAQTSRLSNTLTQLTDEIIRSGSRLAYEVEVLRGETIGLTDTFKNGLKKDIELFVPQKTPTDVDANGHADEEAAAEKAADFGTGEPEFLERLRTLTTVRERLDSVIKTFGAAMQWPLAPSELSIASSFISVSGPDNDDNRDREEKGKEYSEKLRTEVNDLLAAGAEGLESATIRVDELRTLAEVWKGTTEEKARYKIVENLQKLVDDKQRALDKASGESSRKTGASSARGYDYRYGNMEMPKAQPTQPEGGSGYGFLQNLKNLRNEMYLD
ncbi:Hypothetical predicted protein [Lecanosticta acicola]|uniref:Uncharacterized protein n=1 Tax=Lecanosticta acicola TaxID=111012 RepID=A0AAI8YR79_9PEZI|nr:Hypothetical predicted protein [Lecanosticta acicola]